MQEEDEIKPGWLMPLLEAKFYSLCERHGSKNTFFCLDCMGLVLCEGCLKAKIHPHHHILQVYKSSHQVAIKTDSLDKLIDVSEVQHYTNNESKVVFINQRRQKEEPPSNSSAIAAIKVSKCETCGWQLLQGTSKFCSIQCKVTGEGHFRMQPIEIRCERVESFKRTSNKLPVENSFRKRSRKGTPERSPLL